MLLSSSHLKYPLPTPSRRTAEPVAAPARLSLRPCSTILEELQLGRQQLLTSHYKDYTKRVVGMKLKVACRKIYDYVRHDLKEIAFPSSLPDPPHIKKRHKLTWKERFLVLKEASRLYAASWVRDIGPDLRPNDYKKEERKDESNGEKGTTKDREPSTLEDLAVAARGGMETLRPALQRVYKKSWRRRKILNLNLERTLQKDLYDLSGTCQKQLFVMLGSTKEI
ncbi:unnamed protein product [Fraxinus pennsylvanica]|uniref:Uncharacterized protein n=1 Tax=Fraxinus pennsylvanica TaxID=56036 RepID=A0AAD2ADX2_9LAMI|nr:unnamed protein product [Fraxinus pennsylvanica]